MEGPQTYQAHFVLKTRTVITNYGDEKRIMKDKTIKLENLYILNDYDRPCMYLLATKEPLQYACLSMRRKFPNPAADVGNMTNLKDFGFVQEGDTFMQTNPSIAKYSDGRPRAWQGRAIFTIEELLTKEKV